MPITKRRRHQRGVKKSRRVKKVRRSRKGRKSMRKNTKRRTHRKYKGGNGDKKIKIDTANIDAERCEEGGITAKTRKLVMI
jgi:hypothetical protein